MRDYLRLPRPQYRAAIALLLFSEHPLQVEQGRRGPNRRPREERRCRWCREDWAVEDETHALLECEAGPLLALREEFLARVFGAVPSLRTPHFNLASDKFLDMLLRGRTTMPMLAEYAASVFALCEQTPPFLDNPASDSEPGEAA